MVKELFFNMPILLASIQEDMCIEMTKILIITFAIFFGIPIIIIYSIMKIRKEKLEKEELERQWQEEEKRRKEEEKKKLNDYILFYNKCKRNSLNKIETDEEKRSLRLIASAFGITETSKAIEYYNIGKKEVEKRNQNIIEHEIEEQKKRADKEKSEAYKKSRSQYTEELDKLAKSIKAMKDVVDSSKKLFQNGTMATSSNINPYMAAGIGSALGGSTLGLMAGMDAQRENEQGEAAAARTREESWKNLNNAYALGTELNISLDRITWFIDKSNKRMYDNNKESVSLLKLSDMKCENAANTNNLIIKGKISVKADADLKLLRSAAILDGSVKINIYDPEKNLVGSAYYTAPGVKIEKSGNEFAPSRVDFNSVGFSKIPKDFDLICIVEQNRKYNCWDEKFTFKIEPIRLWLIEKV